MCNDRGDKPTVRSNRAFPSSETIVAFEISPSSIRSWALTDLFRPCLIVSSNVFQVVFVHLACNSALLLTSCCCSFSLHVAANLIYVFLASRQLILFPPLPKFLHCLCGQNIFLGLVLQTTVSEFSGDISIPKFSATTFAIQIKTRANLQTSPLRNVRQQKLMNH